MSPQISRDRKIVDKNEEQLKVMGRDLARLTFTSTVLTSIIMLAMVWIMSYLYAAGARAGVAHKIPRRRHAGPVRSPHTHTHTHAIARRRQICGAGGGQAAVRAGGPPHAAHAPEPQDPRHDRLFRVLCVRPVIHVAASANAAVPQPVYQGPGPGHVVALRAVVKPALQRFTVVRRTPHRRSPTATHAPIQCHSPSWRSHHTHTGMGRSRNRYPEAVAPHTWLVCTHCCRSEKGGEGSGEREREGREAIAYVRSLAGASFTDALVASASNSYRPPPGSCGG